MLAVCLVLGLQAWRVNFRYPADPKQFFIKRVIGLPGETVSVDFETPLDKRWSIQGKGAGISSEQAHGGKEGHGKQQQRH